MFKFKNLVLSILVSLTIFGGFAFASLGTGGINGQNTWCYDSIGDLVPCTGSDVSVGTLKATGITLTGNLDLGGFDILQVDSIYGSTSILPVRIGDAGTTTHALTNEDNLLVTGKLEVDGWSFFDSITSFYDSAIMIDGKQFKFGTGSDSSVSWQTVQTPDGLMIGVGSDNNSLIIAEEADIVAGYDFAHALETNPTIFLQSATQSATEYGKLTHDQTYFQITEGTGNGVSIPNLVTGAISLADDAGEVILADLPITPSATAGDVMSMSFAIDGFPVLTVYGEADGSGGPQNQSVILKGETLQNQGGDIRNITTVNAATYDLLITDDLLDITYTGTGAVTSLTLPTAQVTAGRTLTLKDSGGNSAVNNITVDTEGAETIDGSATLVISTNYASVNLYSDGTDWFIF